MTSWNRPSFVEIDMSAEIGAYQEDPTRDDRDEPIADTAAVRDEKAAVPTGESGAP